MGLLADIVSILQTAGIGTAGTNLFYSTMPPTPDLCVCVYSYAGRSPSRIPRYEQPGLQIKVRGAAEGYDAAETKMQSVLSTLHGKGSFTVSTNKYKAILATGSPFFMGFDENKRPMIVCNFAVIKDI
jgi:hypothetical protein